MMTVSRPVLRVAAAVATAALLATSPALAAPPPSKGPCYSVAEFEAEQGIRLHTELMVVGLTCQHMDVKGEPSLFNQYKLFTLKHQARIQAWEKTLVEYYKRTAKGNATRNFDTFRTRLANETSQRAIALSTPVFCGTHAPLVAKAMAAGIEDIQRGFSPDSDGVRMANAPRCDRPAPPGLIADATQAPASRTAVAAATPTPAAAAPVKAKAKAKAQ